MEKKAIYCPKCKRQVATYDGKASVNIEVNCKKCKRRVVFYPCSGETKTKKIPPRQCGSGITFY